mgnify:CR=1 FL=1
MGADSTGFSTKRYETWFSLKANKNAKRRGWIKLHVIISTATLIILSTAITKGTKHDAPLLEKLLKNIPKGCGDFSADSAYLSRKICNLIRMKGRIPFINPKKNSLVKKRGSQAWREMIELYLKDRREFEKRYHRRNSVESVYSTLKRVYGNPLSSRKRRMQRRELMLKVIAHNIRRVNLTTIAAL